MSASHLDDDPAFALGDFFARPDLTSICLAIPGWGGVYCEAMDRKDLQKLAQARLEDAKTLLDNGRADAAYYLAGYIVECALKACIAKQTKEHDFPPEPGFVSKVYSHNLETLVDKANLKPIFDREVDDDNQFGLNWSVVRDWSEKSRYEFHGENKARDMLNAVLDADHGVLQCIRRHW